MAHIVHDSEGSGTAVAVVAIVVLLIIVGAFVVYALPAMRDMGAAPAPQTIKVEIPTPSTNDAGAGAVR